ERDAGGEVRLLGPPAGVVVPALEVDLAGARAAPDDAAAERHGAERGRLDAERGDERETVARLVGLEDRDLLGSDEVADDVLHDRERLAAVERAVEPVARDVQAREVRVLLLDLDVLLGEPAGLPPHLPQAPLGGVALRPPPLA